MRRQTRDARRRNAAKRMKLVCTIGLVLLSARSTGASGTGDNLPMNFSYNQGKLLGMTDDGLMAYVRLHSLWHVSIWTYVAQIPRD